MSESQADKLRLWLASGGTFRVLEVDERHALIDLCTCTGEPMERCLIDDPAALQQVHDEP